MNFTKLVEQFIEATSNRPLNIAVIGDAMIDEFFEVSVSRIAPEAPIPIMRSTSLRPIIRPGGAANVVSQMERLNAQGFLIAPLDDQALCDLDIVTAYCVSCWWTIPRKRRYIGTNGQLLARHDIEMVCGEDDLGEFGGDMMRVRQALRGRFDQLFRSTNLLDAVILSDYAKGSLDYQLIRHVIDTCNSRKIPVLVDPKNRPLADWAGCTVLKLNGAEADAAGNHNGHAIRDTLGCAAVVITRADRPPTVCVSTGAFDVPEGPLVTPASVSGAGDCFLAWLAVAIAHKFKMDDAATIAHLAGNCYVMGDFNDPVSIDEVLGMVDPVAAKLRPLNFSAREQTEGKVVFSNGCFDILHAGHVQTLQWAKEQGDWLIVGVNSDVSVRRIKGPGRPIIGQEDRARTLASLSFVDSVVIFDQDTPEDLMRKLRPDILVKGFDYRSMFVAGSDLAELRIAPDFGGLHTSDIVRKIETLE